MEWSGDWWRGLCWRPAVPRRWCGKPIPDRTGGATGYEVMQPDEDSRRDYRCICDASGDPNLLDTLIMRLAAGGEIVLAGFYADRLSFAFPMAFIKRGTIPHRRAMAAG